LNILLVGPIFLNQCAILQETKPETQYYNWGVRTSKELQ